MYFGTDESNVVTAKLPDLVKSKVAEIFEFMTHVCTESKNFVIYRETVQYQHLVFREQTDQMVSDLPKHGHSCNIV